jgi:hypothetical protein
MVLLSSMKLSTELFALSVFALLTDMNIDFIKLLLYTELMIGQAGEVVTF